MLGRTGPFYLPPVPGSCASGTGVVRFVVSGESMPFYSCLVPLVTRFALVGFDDYTFRSDKDESPGDDVIGA
jgi:hypothetical protein